MLTEQRTITFNQTAIAYIIKRSRRRRRSMSIRITQAGVTVNVPPRESYLTIEKLMLKHGSWILKKLAQTTQQIHFLPAPDLMVSARQQGLSFLSKRINLYQKILNIQCKILKISNQKTQWGNCSRQGVIRLNWRLMLIPLALTDYVVVHELCHLVHFNHSPEFWQLVETVVPDYKAKRKALHQMAWALQC